MQLYGFQKVYIVSYVTILMKKAKRAIEKIKLLELNEAYNKALLWFFSYPDKEISLSDLSENLGISKTTANRVVNRLVGERFLKLDVLGRVWRISVNKGHIFNYSKKIGFNLMMIYESNLIEEIHKTIPSPKAIVLFGSYRKGDDTEESDIDIAVEVIDDKELRILETELMPHMGYREKVPLKIHVFSRNKIDLNLFSNIANGIVLEGFLEVRL